MNLQELAGMSNHGNIAGRCVRFMYSGKQRTGIVQNPPFVTSQAGDISVVIETDERFWRNAKGQFLPADNYGESSPNSIKRFRIDKIESDVTEI